MGSSGVIALTNGSFVVRSTSWDDGATVNVGAVTWGSGSTGSSGVVSASNSQLGGVAGAGLGAICLEPLNNFFATRWATELTVRLGSQENGFYPPPVITAITPNTGTFAGSTSVTITGTGFAGTTGVTIGGIAATSVTVVSSTSISCTTPAGTEGAHSVLVTTPGGTNPANTLFTYTNSAPTDIGLSATTIAENNAASAPIGTLGGTDPDTGDAFTYSFASGGADNASFSIADSTLRLTPSADFETKSSYGINIRCTDAGGRFFEKSLTITITDANDAPTFTGYIASTPYQTAATISLGKLLTTAADIEGDALSVTAAGPASTQGGSAVLQGGSILYTPPTGYSGTDTFPVTITDARGASVVGTVTVTVQSNTGIGLNPPVPSILSGGRIGLDFQGIPGRSYEVQRSTDLSTWQTLTTVTASLTNGAVSFIDESPPPGSGHYRLRKP